MNSSVRFTLPNNPILNASFDEIENSYNLGIFKTTNNGQYFLDEANSLNIQIEDCVVIDDSVKVCRVFENLGGKAINSFGV